MQEPGEGMALYIPLTLHKTRESVMILESCEQLSEAVFRMSRVTADRRI